MTRKEYLLKCAMLFLGCKVRSQFLIDIMYTDFKGTAIHRIAYWETMGWLEL